MNSQDLLQPKEVLVINLMDYVLDLDRKYGRHFIQPEPGIYMVGHVEPILSSTKTYFTPRSLKKNEPLKNLDTVREAVLDEMGTVVITQYVMERREKLLKTMPTVPTRAIQLAKVMVDSYIDETVVYKPTSTYKEEMDKYLLPEGQKMAALGYLDAACERLFCEIARFIDRDVWNIYFVKLTNTDLVIEKSIDWRIFEWTRRMESGRWS